MMTETTEQPQTTIEDELTLVAQQKQERLNYLATNDPVFQQLIGYERGLQRQTSGALSNGTPAHANP